VVEVEDKLVFLNLEVQVEVVVEINHGTVLWRTRRFRKYSSCKSTSRKLMVEVLQVTDPAYGWWRWWRSGAGWLMELQVVMVEQEELVLKFNYRFTSNLCWWWWRRWINGAGPGWSRRLVELVVEEQVDYGGSSNVRYS
jgi:hypothetical protein